MYTEGRIDVYLEEDLCILREGLMCTRRKNNVYLKKD